MGYFSSFFMIMAEPKKQRRIYGEDREKANQNLRAGDENEGGKSKRANEKWKRKSDRP